MMWWFVLTSFNKVNIKPDSFSTQYTHIRTRYIPDIGAVTRMEELPRLQASRRAHKAHVTRLVNKINQILVKETPEEMELVNLNTSIEQLTRKKNLIREMDQKIEAEITDTKDLENEIFEAEELSCDLEEKINHIRKYIDSSINATRNTYMQQPLALLTN